MENTTRTCETIHFIEMILSEGAIPVGNQNRNNLEDSYIGSNMNETITIDLGEPFLKASEGEKLLNKLGMSYLHEFIFTK